MGCLHYLKGPIVAWLEIQLHGVCSVGKYDTFSLVGQLDLRKCMPGSRYVNRFMYSYLITQYKLFSVYQRNTPINRTWLVIRFDQVKDSKISASRHITSRNQRIICIAHLIIKSVKLPAFHCQFSMCCLQSPCSCRSIVHCCRSILEESSSEVHDLLPMQIHS